MRTCPAVKCFNCGKHGHLSPDCRAIISSRVHAATPVDEGEIARQIEMGERILPRQKTDVGKERTAKLAQAATEMAEKLQKWLKPKEVEVQEPQQPLF